MSDPGRPFGSRLKGKFKALYNRLSESRRPFNENLSTGLRLGFTSASVHLMLMRSLQGVLRLQKAQLWYISTLCVNKFFCSYFMGHQNVLQGAHNLIIKGSNFYTAQNVCSMMVVITEILIQFFFSRWSLTNNAAAFRMIHFPFPRNQIQVPYLQVVRI